MLDEFYTLILKSLDYYSEPLLQKSTLIFYVCVRGSSVEVTDI